ncbi:MAG TPA: SDR family oxidoreductase [Bacteroidota bacterium]|nr:SDR family oxidoreductase [Bacteroidota bacterium]
MNDRVVLITGSSRGIGRAAALLFAETGARVAVHYNRNRRSAQETLAMLPGSGHMVFQADLGVTADAQRLVNEVLRQMHRIDVLVNNAGLWVDHPLATTTFEDWVNAWEKTIGTNLMGAAYVAHGAALAMIRQGGGRIINITSRGAFRGEPDGPAYAASKAGMNAMSQSLAKALAPHNICVFAIAPGWVDTDMAKPLLQGSDGDAIRAQSPMNRVATPEEVARTLLFLGSEGTDALTGCIIDVNCASYLRT